MFKFLQNIALFTIILFLTKQNANSQAILDFKWQMSPVKDGNLIITSLTKSNNDSVIYALGYYYQNPTRIYTINSETSNILKIDTVQSKDILEMSKDSKSLIALNNTSFCFLNPTSFENIYCDTNIGYNIYASNYNNKQNKLALAIATNSGQKLIRIFDCFTNLKTNEINLSFLNKYMKVNNIKLSNDGNSIILGIEERQEFPVGNFTKHYHLKIINTSGLTLKDIKETNSANFSTTNDEKKIIYFKQDSVHLYDINTSIETVGFAVGGTFPNNIEMSSDDKFMLIGYKSGLVYYNLQNNLSYFVNNNTEWNIFKLSTDNKNVFNINTNFINKYQFQAPASVNKSDFILDFTVNVQGDILIISSPIELNNFNFNISSIDGKLQKQILPNEIRNNSISNEIDISSLSIGIYFLTIFDKNNKLTNIKFIKSN